MGSKNQHEYHALREKLIQGIRQGDVKNTWRSASEYLNIKLTTLSSAALREWNIKLPFELLGTLGDDGPGKLGLSIDENPNTLEVNYTFDYKSRIVTTLEGALEKAKVDLKTWEVQDYVVNFWPVGMKLKHKDVEVASTIQLCQIKIWLVRKVLKPIMPVIQPVDLPAVKVKPLPKKAAQGDLKRALIIPDVHVGFRRSLHTRQLEPFHDRRVLDLALQLLQGGDFQQVYFIGDCLDLAEWSSKFTPEPEFYFTTQPAIIEWAWWLSQFRAAAPRAEIYQWEGNHDKRLRDMISGYMRAAYGLRAVDELELPPSMSVERLLALHKLDVKYVAGYPDNTIWVNRNVLIRHGDTVRSGPGDSAKAVVTKTTYTTIFGHVHRSERVTRRIKTREGDEFQKAFSPGCACHIDGRVPGSTSEDQWQQGLAILEYTDDRENIISIDIEAGVAIHDGKILTARARDKEIEAMLDAKLEKL